jgi:hypothetical protein
MHTHINQTLISPKRALFPRAFDSRETNSIKETSKLSDLFAQISRIVCLRREGFIRIQK